MAKHVFSLILFLLFSLMSGQKGSAATFTKSDSVLILSKEPIKIDKKWKSRFYGRGLQAELKNYGFGLGGYNGGFSGQLQKRNWNLKLNAGVSNFGSLYSTKYLNYNSMFGADNVNPRNNIVGARGETNLLLPGKITKNDFYNIKFGFSPGRSTSIRIEQSGKWITDSVHYQLNRFSFKENGIANQKDLVLGERALYNRLSKATIGIGRFSNKPDVSYSFAIDHTRESSNYSLSSNADLETGYTSQSLANNLIALRSTQYIHELRVPKISLAGRRSKFKPLLQTTIKYNKTKENLNWRMDQNNFLMEELQYQTDITQVAERTYRTFDANLKFTNWLKKSSKLKLEFTPKYVTRSAAFLREASQSSISPSFPEIEMNELASSRLNETSAEIALSYKRWKLKIAPTAAWQNSDTSKIQDLASRSDDVNYFLPVKFESPTARKLRLMYVGRVLSPTFYQLLPFQDRINPTYIFNGNPDLEYGFSHKLTVNKYFPRALRLLKKNAKKAKAFMNLEVSAIRQLNPIVLSVNYDSTGNVNVNYTNVIYTDQLQVAWKWTQRIGKKIKLTLKPQYSITNYGYRLNDSYQTAWNNTLDVAFDARLKLRNLQVDVMADYFNVVQEYNQNLGMLGKFEMLGIGAKIKGRIDDNFTFSVFGGFNQLLSTIALGEGISQFFESDNYFKLDLTAKVWSKNKKVAFGLIARDLLGQNQMLRAFTTANTVEQAQGRSQGRAILFTVSLAVKPRPRFHGF